uniref:Uncharacterized protein n=1 Tax=Tanacetum cinerariifolium TaxID=118510 RepID=A0A6L2NB59_TANCI|nr:hypothetical protein [Tanacetum cinerariifolium]
MIFDGMLRNLDNVSGKILMYPRFIQTFFDKQLDGLPTHKEKYDVSFHIKIVFANMKRIGKGFSDKKTPLFPTMVMVLGAKTPWGIPLLILEDKLKRTKTSQQTKIAGLERRVKKLKNKHRSRTYKLKRLYKVGLTAKVISFSDDEALYTSKQGRIDKIDTDEDIALVSTHNDVSTQDNIVQDEGIKDVDEEEVVEVVTTAKMIIDTVVDTAQVAIAIADILVSTAKTIVTTALTITTESTKTNVKVTQAPKRKGVMIQEPKETTTTKQLLYNNLRFRTKKQRKFFAAKRDEEKRNKSPTKAQQRIIMSTYLENIDGWKIISLKKKTFAEIQELFNKVMKRIYNFINFRTELVEEGSKKDKVTEGLPNVLELKDATTCHLKISAITLPAWKNHLDNHMRSRELLHVIRKLRGEYDVMKDRERAMEEECEELQANEVGDLKQFRREVESKFIPYATMELMHSDDMGSLVGKIVSFAILYGRCRAYEQVVDMKKPFELSKVKGCRYFYKKDHILARNDLSTATFPWLDEFVADPLAPIEALLSKKPPSLQRLVPSRT